MEVDSETVRRVLAAIDEDRVIALASKLISIPSWNRKGQDEVAKYCASYMRDIGMEVELQDVIIPEGGGCHPPETVTKQAVGKFIGSEGKPSLMLCSHIDAIIPYKFDLWTKPLGLVENGWIYGVGGQKCGMAAMLEAARVVKQTVRIKGDLIVACVAEEMSGGLGIQQLLDSGMRPDMAIVGEDTDLQLCTVSVAPVFGAICIEGRPDRPKGAGGVDPLAKAFKILQELRPFQPAKPGGWLTFKPHPDLPGYPRFNVISIRHDPSLYPLSCTILFDCRIVPGQNEETVRRDLENLMSRLKEQDPDLAVKLVIPPPGWINRVPFEVSPEEYIVQTIAKWHKFVTGEGPYVGSGIRLGFSSDANNLMAAGVKCVNYGPGDFKEPINERKKVADIIKAAKVYALTALEICG